MRIMKDRLWTWFLPDVERPGDRDEWVRHGGKWIVFGSRDEVESLAERLGALMDSGVIRSAKCWNGDPSAINVYSLDSEKENTWKILRELGAGDARVWEYDYAMCKNAVHPADFLFSWSSKFRTILQSYGLPGTLRLIGEVFFSR